MEVSFFVRGLKVSVITDKVQVLILWHCNKMKGERLNWKSNCRRVSLGDEKKLSVVGFQFRRALWATSVRAH